MVNLLGAISIFFCLSTYSKLGMSLALILLMRSYPFKKIVKYTLQYLYSIGILEF